VVFLKEQTETKNGKEYTNYYFYHGNTYLGKAEEGLSTIQANIKDELGETVDPEKIEKLQEEAREKMETEVKDNSEDYMDLDLDLDHWSRAKKRETSSHLAVWEFGKDRDVTVEIIEQDDGQEGKYYDVLERVGGYTEHEIATAVMDVEKAIEEAERAMRTANDNKAQMADSDNDLTEFEEKVLSKIEEVGGERLAEIQLELLADPYEGDFHEVANTFGIEETEDNIEMIAKETVKDMKNNSDVYGLDDYELSDIEAKPPEIGDEFYHVRVRDPSRYETERVPDWASDVAGSVSKGSKVKMGKLGQGDWEVQSVMIKKSNVDRKKAKDLAEEIAMKVDGSDSEMSDSDTDIFAGDEFADRIANSELIYQDWDEDSVANIDDRDPLSPGDPEAQRVNEEILLSEELKNIEELSENHREVYEMLKDEVDIHKGRVKQPESILKKLHEKYSEEVTDIIGVTIMADDKEEVMQVAQELKDRHALYPIGEERADENHYEDDEFYRAYHLIIEVEHDGEKYPAEVQIKTEEQAKLHELAHEYYKRNEDMPELLEEKARQLESGEIDSVNVDELKKKLP